MIPSDEALVARPVEQVPLPAIGAPAEDFRDDGRLGVPGRNLPGEGRFGAPGQYGAAPSGEPLGSVARPPMTIGPDRPATFASLPPEDQPEEGEPKELPAHLKRQLVDYATKEPAGTIVIDTQHTYLYYVLGGGKAIRYGIGVGREGFTWAGRERISRMTEWPDWYPPADMIERQPYLPRMMAGGPGHPLGARALYLGNTLYRIHGTNQPSTIGKFVSSGCIRMLNDDAIDLFGRVQVGTRVAVLAGGPPKSASGETPAVSGAGQPTPIAAAPAAGGIGAPAPASAPLPSLR
jgi:lipoprotein-anchoring transpeptidase ErfK/SrfK